LCTTNGGELKGLSFTSLWAGRDQALIDRLVRSVFDASHVIVVAFDGRSKSGRANPFEMVILPLNGGVDSPRCIGAISPVRKPFWLGADPIVEAAVESVRVVDPDQEAMVLGDRAAIDVPALSPIELDGAGIGENTNAPRRIRHLVVLDGGRSE